MDEGKSERIIFSRNNLQSLKIPTDLNSDELFSGPTIEVIILPE